MKQQTLIESAVILEDLAQDASSLSSKAEEMLCLAKHDQQEQGSMVYYSESLALALRDGAEAIRTLKALTR